MTTERTDSVPGPPTMKEAVEEAAGRLAAAGVEPARLEARLLLGHVLGLAKEGIISRDAQRISWESHTALGSLVERRLAGEPVAYLRGLKEFWSLDFAVDRRVLIPRADTEILVESCLEHLGATGGPVWAVDAGTGSGAIAVALAHTLDHVRVLGIDASREALEVAHLNVCRHGLADRVLLAAGDLLGPVRRDPPHVQCIAANLPYVASDEIPGLDPGIRDHEPRIAIDGGPDGLALVSRLVEEAPGCLVPGGLVALEIADRQAPAVASMLSASRDLSDVRIRPDLGRLKRVVTARRRA